MTAKHQLTAADGTPEDPLPEHPVLTARDDDGPRMWQNRALLAEAQLATLRAAYEPTSTPKEN